MGRVEDKVAIITGAASGLGRAQALLLAREGAKVIVADINEVGGKAVVEEITSAGGQALFMKHDVRSERDWSELIEKALAEYGKLDILVNNAGVFLLKKLEDTSLEEWHRVTSVNLDGAFLGIKYSIGAMKKSGGGSIINISSATGIVGAPEGAAYSASKGGVKLLTKVAAYECSKAGYDYNIRVNSVHPGLVETSMIAPLKSETEEHPNPLEWHLMKRVGQPEEIAYGVLYLASDESEFVTGAELVIDGGWTAH